MLAIDFDFSVRKSADGRIHCESWRVPRVSTVYRTRHAVFLSLSLLPYFPSPMRAKCTAVAFPRVRIRIRERIAVAADRYRRSPIYAPVAVRVMRILRTYNVAADRCTVRREATYVIPVTRFSNQRFHGTGIRGRTECKIRRNNYSCVVHATKK